MSKKTKGIAAGMIVVIIPLLVFVFGEGVFWRFFPKNADQVTSSAAPYSTSDATEATNSNAMYDSNDEAMLPISQPDTTDNVIISEVSNADNQMIPIETIQIGTTSNSLSLFINDCQYFYNGFYYRAPETESSYSYIEYDQGISGHFSYSRELTDIEYATWGHNGEILDADGNKLDIEASFYASSDGIFAISLPKNMPSGNYVYLLRLYMGDEHFEMRIPFTW